MLTMRVATQGDAPFVHNAKRVVSVHDGGPPNPFAVAFTAISPTHPVPVWPRAVVGVNCDSVQCIRPTPRAMRPLVVVNVQCDSIQCTLAAALPAPV